MASNVQLSTNVGTGAVAATAQIAHDGDTAQLQLVGLMGIAGTEDAYTVAKIDGTAANGLDVDVTRVIPGTAATALGKAEDAAAASGDTGVLMLGVRRDTAASGADTDGDYATLNLDANGRLHANVGAVPAPLSTTGGGTEVAALRVTVASDSTGVLSVDDNGGSLTVDGTVSVSGAVDTELPAAEALGDALANPTTPLIGSAALMWGGTVWARQRSGGGVEASALRVTIANDSTGVLSVDDNGSSLTVDGTVTANLAAGTNNIGDVDVLSVVPGTGATALGKAVDDAAGATDTGVAILAVRDDSLATLTPVDGDYVPLRVNSTGALHVTGGGGGTEYAVDTALGATPTGSLAIAIRDDALSALTPVEGDAIGLRVDANGALWVIPSGTVTVSGTVTANLAAGTNNVGDVDVLSIAAGDNNIGNVDVVTLPNVTLAAGTNTNEVVGDAAHGAAAAGNPLLTGLEGRSTAPTAVDDGDVVRALSSLLGKQVVLPYAIPANSWSYAAASGGITNTTGVTALSAPGAGIRAYVTRAQIINGHATVSTDVQIRDGASGTVMFRAFAQAAGGGVTAVFDPPLRFTANTLVEIACGTTGSATYVNLQGYTAAE